MAWPSVVDSVGVTADEEVIPLAGVDGAILEAGLDAGVPEDDEEEDEGAGAPPAGVSLYISCPLRPSRNDSQFSG